MLAAQVLRTSNLYRSEPMYVEDQPPFTNAAALIATTLAPHDLLAALKRAEQQGGRNLADGVRWGPRPLDLDIVFYGRERVRTERLTIPHERWRERPFVTVPVGELARAGDAAGMQVRARAPLAPRR